jgi:hypothetical protein
MVHWHRNYFLLLRLCAQAKHHRFTSWNSLNRDRLLKDDIDLKLIATPQHNFLILLPYMLSFCRFTVLTNTNTMQTMLLNLIDLLLPN